MTLGCHSSSKRPPRKARSARRCGLSSAPVVAEIDLTDAPPRAGRRISRCRGTAIRWRRPVLLQPRELSAASCKRARCLPPIPSSSSASTAAILVWRDGTRMPLDDGKGDEAVRRVARAPRHRGHAGGALSRRRRSAAPPAKDVDPGRARNAAFFDKVYGDCRKGEVEKNLDDRRLAAEEDGPAAAVQQDQRRGEARSRP